MNIPSNIPQWMRQCSALIGSPGHDGILIQNLRMTFDIKKTSTSDYNTGKIEIYNLNKNNRQAVNDTDMTVTVTAGYQGNVGTLYIGDITFANSQIKRPETVLTIESNDGHRTVHQLKFPCSYGAGISGKQIIKDIVKKSGIGVKNVKWEQLPDANYIQGFTYRGMAKQLLDNVCDYIGLEWSIQDGQFQFLVSGHPNQNKVISLTPDTGLIGSPQGIEDIGREILRDTKGALKIAKHNFKAFQKTKQRRLASHGLRVDSLLIPSAEPGGVVEVTSEKYDTALWRIIDVHHTGDTHGDDWKTTLTCMSYDTSWTPSKGNTQHVEGGGVTAPEDSLDDADYPSDGTNG